MNRRRLIRDLLSAAALAAAPAVLRADSRSASCSERFAAAATRERWLAGWQNAARDTFGPTVAEVQGRLPSDLAGVLYRNGPAVFERAGFRYRHWFDGDGMMSAWQLRAGLVEHRARIVATSKFSREQQHDRFLLPAGGTTVPDALPVRNNDDMNTANTAVVYHDSRVLALWEGGSATALDPQTLRALGPVRWREDLVAAPFSAHPLADRDGSLWNFGLLSMVGGSGVLIWHIGADSKLIRVAVLPVEKPGYMHAFAMTGRYLVFMLMPYRREGEGVAFFERMRFETGEPCRVAVVDKGELDAPRWFEVPFGPAYHFGKASLRKGLLTVPVVRHLDPEQMRSPMAGAMCGERGDSLGTELSLLQIDLASGRARWEGTGLRGLEFPTYDSRYSESRTAPVYALTSVEPVAAPYGNAVAVCDTGRGSSEVYRYGSDIMAEEHVFVPRRDSRRPGQGWLIGALLDHRRARSGMAVLDAEHIGAGPVAQAWVPYVLPLGFHGSFVSSA